MNQQKTKIYRRELDTDEMKRTSVAVLHKDRSSAMEAAEPTRPTKGQLFPARLKAGERGMLCPSRLRLLSHPRGAEVRTMAEGSPTPLHRPHGQQRHGERPRHGRQPGRRRRGGLRGDGGRVAEGREGRVGLERVRVGRARAGRDGGLRVGRRRGGAVLGGGGEHGHYVRRQRRRRRERGVGAAVLPREPRERRVRGRRGDGRRPERGRGGAGRREVERQHGREDGEEEMAARARPRHRSLPTRVGVGVAAWRGRGRGGEVGGLLWRCVPCCGLAVTWRVR